MPSNLAQRIVSEARSWKGTRWQHQGRIRGLGVDCVGYISEVAKAVGLEIEIPNDYRPHEDGVVMVTLLREHMKMVPTEKMKSGDVLALCDEALQKPDVPRHLAFVTEVTPTKTTIIHSSQHGVVEHRINSVWRSRIHSCWRIV